MEWSSDSIISLIGAYRDRPMLWDSSHRFYKTLNRKNNAWADLANMFKCDVVEVKKKINSLLSSFRRERRKSGCARFGDGADDAYQSSWFAYSHFDFLVDKYNPRQTKNTIEARHSDDMDSDVQGQEMSASEENAEETVMIKTEPDILEDVGNHQEEGRFIEFISPQKRAQFKRKRSSEDPRLGEALKILKRASSMQRDECSVYGEHVANKLRKLDNCTRCIAQHSINNLLFEAEMGKFSVPNQRYESQLAYGNAEATPSTHSEMYYPSVSSSPMSSPNS